MRKRGLFDVIEWERAAVVQWHGMIHVAHIWLPAHTLTPGFLSGVERYSHLGHVQCGCVFVQIPFMLDDANTRICFDFCGRYNVCMCAFKQFFQKRGVKTSTAKTNRLALSTLGVNSWVNVSTRTHTIWWVTPFLCKNKINIVKMWRPNYVD